MDRCAFGCVPAWSHLVCDSGLDEWGSAGRGVYAGRLAELGVRGQVSFDQGGSDAGMVVWAESASSNAGSGGETAEQFGAEAVRGAVWRKLRVAGQHLQLARYDAMG